MDTVDATQIKLGTDFYNSGGDYPLDAYIRINQALSNLSDIDSEIRNLSQSKVDKEEGKGLSSNDFTDDMLHKLESLPDLEEITDYKDSLKSDIEDIYDELAYKVDKVDGATLFYEEDRIKFNEMYQMILDLRQLVEGKLSSNDYTDEDKALVNTIANKVDKITGKGLSTNDFTSELKSKLENL